jgi:8-oxo-dGTP pyrophosphatase MutT (NUDIX family)
MSAPAAPTPAATLLLVRDGAQALEVFMVERHAGADFVPGAMVFPGGKLEPGDAEPGLARLCAGASGLSAQALGFRVAALREAFEECGVLLAREAGSQPLVGCERVEALARRWREPLQAGRATLAEMLAAEALELACDLPLPFAHWITPEGVHRRFDTHFFLVATPPEQAARHDGGETVSSLWIPPAEALAREAAGRITMIFPTLLNLRRLARSTSVAEALAAARAAKIVTVLPRIERGEHGMVLRIPEDAGYGFSEAPLDALPGSPLPPPGRPRD